MVRSARLARARHGAPRSMVATAMLLLCAWSRSMLAQTAADSTLSGRITTQDGRPVFGALVRLVQGPVVRETRSGPDGGYRIPGLATGSWIYSVQAIGHRRAVGRVELSGQGRTFDISIERLPTQLDTVRIASSWAGLRITIGDARTFRPLDSVRVRLLGRRRILGAELTEFITDKSGRYELEQPAGASITLAVERNGYDRRLVHAIVPQRGAAEIVIGLDTAAQQTYRERQWQDLIWRLRGASSRAVQVGGEELFNTRAGSLKEALLASPSAIGGGLPPLTRDACLFIDGIPQPGMPADGLDVSMIAFVEAYPAGAEHSETLKYAWTGGPCGAPTGGAEERRDPREKIQYLVVWMKRPKTATP